MTAVVVALAGVTAATAATGRAQAQPAAQPAPAPAPSQPAAQPAPQPAPAPAPAPAPSQPAPAAEPLPTPAAPSTPGGKPLTLAQALPYALEHNPELAMAGESVAGAQARIESAKALRLPKLAVEANVIRWDEELVFDLAIPGLPTPDPAPPPTVIRDQITSTITVTAAQPLSGLLVIGKLIGTEEAGLRAARADLSGAQLDVAAQTAAAFLRALSARAVLAIATDSVAQLQGHLARARTLAAAGVLGDIDVLRLDAALAAAEQQQLSAQVDVRNADEALLLILGMSVSEPVEPVDRFPAQLAPPDWDEDRAVAAALADRPDLAAADARADQAAGVHAVARANLYPSINAIANYSHNEGQGTFQAKDAWFVGVNLQWDVWDWGKTRADARAAAAGASAARQSAARARDRVALEVRALVRTVRAVHLQLQVAERGERAAAEAHRLQSVRFREGAGTTTDVIDAQTELSRARAQRTAARYAYLTALAQLYRGLGALPTEIAQQEGPGGGGGAQ